LLHPFFSLSFLDPNVIRSSQDEALALISLNQLPFLNISPLQLVFPAGGPSELVPFSKPFLLPFFPGDGQSIPFS